MSIDVKLYQASQHCERAARRARELLHLGDLITESQLEDVRGCILVIEETRQRVPTGNPGFHEAALMRLVQAYTEESDTRHDEDTS
jgi:hypothetical protein